MAGALSLVASVIAVADVAVKAGSAYLKITRLWDEVKQVPATLREKTEEIQLFEEFLHDTERSLSQGRFTELTPNQALLERLIKRCHDTLNQLKDSVDQIHSRVANQSRLKRKIASAKSVLNKDDLEALTSKFDRALNFFHMAQDQQRHWIAIQTYELISKAPFAHPNLELDHIEEAGGPSANILERVIGRHARGKAPAWIRFANMDLVSGPTSITGGFLWRSRATEGFSLTFQAPSWLNQSVFSIMAHRAAIGWQLHLRTHEVVRDFSQDLIQLIHTDDPRQVYQYLEDNRMSPFVLDGLAYNLLHTALRYKSINLARSLINDGLDLNPRHPLRSMGVVATRWSDFSRGSDGYEVIDMLGDVGLDYLLDEHNGLASAISMRISFEGFQLLLKRSRFSRDYPLPHRLEHLRMVVMCSDSNWSWKQVFSLLPEAEAPNLDLLQYSRRDERCDILTSLAMASMWFRYYRGCEDCSDILSAWIKLDPAGLNHVERNRMFGPVQRPLTALLSIIRWALTHDRNRYTDLLQLAQSSLQFWVKAVASAGVDLLNYGRAERVLFEQGVVQMGRRYIIDRRCRGVDYRTRYCVVGITYGPLPEHWRLWFAEETYGFAASFWNMVENTQAEMPGSWVPDLLDDTGKLDIAWAIWDLLPFIWSEYQRIRPPV